MPLRQVYNERFDVGILAQVRRESALENCERASDFVDHGHNDWYMRQQPLDGNTLTPALLVLRRGAHPNRTCSLSPRTSPDTIVPPPHECAFGHYVDPSPQKHTKETVQDDGLAQDGEKKSDG